MGCNCGRMTRFWLLAQNLVLFCAALVLLSVSVDALVEEQSYVATLLGAPVSRGTAMLLAAAASLVLVVSFLGCCGALFQSVVLVGLFGCFSVLLLVVSVAGFCSALYVAGPGAAAAQSSMLRSMVRYGRDTEVTQAWDFLQRDFHCCGVVDGKDWALNATINATVPESCCRRSNGTYLPCTESPTGQNSYVADGCLASARQLFVDHTPAFAGAAAAVVLFLAISAGMACCFGKNIRQASYERLTV
ncbi:CD63 antigen-like [Pollicipes pollicipes]|uniref:CD63 antigen-like n=1 Tax=Pollicipes pollicipes TaxID=41117 RepID=UPI0018858FA4|nr:CD63 antigen-like [Pollicipes pollicipes]